MASPTPESLRVETSAVEGREDTYSPVSPRRRALICIRQELQDSSEESSLTKNRTACLVNHSYARSTSLPYCRETLNSTRALRPVKMRSSSEEQESLMADVESSPIATSRPSISSLTSVSTTSLVLENLNSIPLVKKSDKPIEYRDDDSDPEIPRFKGSYNPAASRQMSKTLRLIIWGISIIAAAGWGVALLSFLVNGTYKHSSYSAYDHESPMKSSGQRVTLDSVLGGEWRPNYASVSWIPGVQGEDGLILEADRLHDPYLTVNDVRSRSSDQEAFDKKVLMKSGWFTIGGQRHWSESYWVSPDMKHVLLMTSKESNFRHSFFGKYYILNVETQEVEPLDPANSEERIQLALWAPTSDAIVFTRNNNMFLRNLSSVTVQEITTDGGPEYFYGVPDWVYEEEVFGTNVATWWARDGQYIAFLRTNETVVPDFPVQFFLSRPSGTQPAKGLENYPEVEQIKYPKAGAPNPVVDILFYDVARRQVFSVDIADGFADNDRIISNVLWADNGKVLIQEGNRESDHIRIVLIDVLDRTGKTVRRVNMADEDGGWIEPGQQAIYVPADPKNGRLHDGYVDTVVYKNYDHLGYFTPIDNPEPIMLTSGEWEIENGPVAVSSANNTVYFVATKQSPTQRHIYGVKLDGTGMHSLVPEDSVGYWEVAFSAAAGYAFLSNQGPGIPFQKLISVPANPYKYEEMLEDNQELGKRAAAYELPHKIFSNVTIDNVTLQVVERRPPHFEESKKYPVLFYLYGGPGSQMVDRKFTVDFESYIASSLGYIVVTVDGRGTGFIGRKARTIVRGQLGKYEAHDQIETAKIWANKPYVDADRMAIWGWSYGGFMTLKVLETDAGQTFRYGMAVAPVTDWRFYDSIYTERYMLTPENNPYGYEESSIHNVTALSQNVRFLVMHGVADDNVHMQNTLTLLDKLDLAGIENYDLHVFPDSNHGIFFHNAYNIVYDKLSNWLVNAFNGEWYKVEDPIPIEQS